MTCKKCNAPINDTDKFCAECGEKVIREETPAAKITSEKEISPVNGTVSEKEVTRVTEVIPEKEIAPVKKKASKAVNSKPKNKKLSPKMKKLFIILAVSLAVVIILLAVLFPKIKRMVLGELNYYLLQEKAQFSEYIDYDVMKGLSSFKGKQTDLYAEVSTVDGDRDIDLFDSFNMSIASDSDGKAIVVKFGTEISGEDIEILNLVFKDGKLILDSENTLKKPYVKSIEINSDDEGMSWLADAMKDILKRSDEYLTIEKDKKTTNFIIDRDGIVNFLNIAVEELKKHDEYTKLMGDTSGEIASYFGYSGVRNYLTGRMKFSKADIDENASLCYSVTYGKHNLVEERVIKLSNRYNKNYILATVNTSKEKDKRIINAEVHPNDSELYSIEIAKGKDSISGELVFNDHDFDYCFKTRIDIEKIKHEKISGVDVIEFDATASYEEDGMEAVSASLSGTVDKDEYILEGKVNFPDGYEDSFDGKIIMSISDDNMADDLPDYSNEKDHGKLEDLFELIDDKIDDACDNDTDESTSSSSDEDSMTGWQDIDGEWYYIDSDGYTMVGWTQVDGKWYYMDSSGAVMTGWTQVDDKWYYMNSSGVMATGWAQIGGKWYYMTSTGVMVTGTQQINGKTYLFNSNGVWIG